MGVSTRSRRAARADAESEQAVDPVTTVVEETAPGSAPAASEVALNQVLLRGRVSGEPTERELPSGAVVVGLRLSVRRDRTTMTTGSKQTVDWVECAAWSAGARRTVARWEVGDVVEVEGSLRRRFPRGGGVSRVEVEVLRARRLARGSSSPPTP
jgi:single-strand DNA-binding protein